jgi:hypothetical protein
MDGTGGTNDCIAYINKVASFGGTYSPGELIVTVPKGSYENTNYYFDDTEIGYSGYTPGLSASNGVFSAGVLPGAIIYTNVTDNGLSCHITNGTDVAGYMCWGQHSSLGAGYATNESVKWSGNSGWWIIETVESYNGDRVTSQGNFLSWYATNAFGGTNYSNTPVGAGSNVDEPYEIPGSNNSEVYFGLWASGKNFAICAWNSVLTDEFQAVGDPFVMN